MTFWHKYLAAPLLVLFLCAPIPALAESGTEKSPAAAHALLEQGTPEQAEAAWVMLLGLLRQDPTALDTNTLMVRAALATGRVNQAITAIERLVSIRPHDPSLRLELAKAYARAGDDAAARAEMEQVQSLAPELSNEAMEEVLAQAATAGRASRELWQISGSISTGAIWDSNVNGGIDNLRLGGDNWLFVLGTDSRKKAAFGEYLNAHISVGRRFNVSSPWWLVSDISFYGKVHNETVPSNQYFVWNNASLGLRYVGSRSIFELRAKGELSNHDPYDRMIAGGAEMTFLYAVTPSLQLMTKAGIDSRNYATSSGRNGTYWNVGQYLRILWGADNSALLGARYLVSNTKELRNDYSGWEVMARLSFSPVSRFTVSPFVAWREQQYRDIPTWISILLREGKRHDRTLMGGVSFTWHWTPSLASELGWQYSRNYSNSTFYKYDQHQINIGLTYKF